MYKFHRTLMLIHSVGLLGLLGRLLNKVFHRGQYRPMKDFNTIEQYFHEKNGLEIGGPSSFFRENGFLPVYNRCAAIDGVNFASSTVWTGTIDEGKGFFIDGIRRGNQYIIDAVDVAALGVEAYDFVLSCNNIEHIANPLKAVAQWLSVLKTGGMLVIVAPRKESNFDHKRNISEFSHLMRDNEQNIKEDDLTHMEEFIRNIDLEMALFSGREEEFIERCRNNFENRCLHHHVFDLNLLKRIYEHFNLSIIKAIQLDDDYVIVGVK